MTLGSVHYQLVKMFITLEPYVVFESKFAYLFILILSSRHDIQNAGEGFLPGQSLLVNTHNSRTACYILIKVCILMYFNIIETQVCRHGD